MTKQQLINALIWEKMNMRKENIAQFLVSYLGQLNDQHTLTTDEIGALRSINHRILEKNPPPIASAVYRYAFHKGECAGERNLICESRNHDNTIHDALTIKPIHIFKGNPKRSDDLIFEFKQVTGKSLPQHELTTNPDGNARREDFRPSST